MKKNELIYLTITDIGTNGEGIGKVDGYAFFVKDALPGDEVKAVITRMNSGYGFAKALEIIKPSPDRIVPPCPHAARCGGCQIMQLDYRKQLEFKEAQVRNNLERIGGQKDFILRPVIGMDLSGNSEGCVPMHFRNKVQFPVGRDADGRVVTGFYAGRTHHIIATEECCVSEDVASAIMKVIRSFIEEHGVSVYDEETGKGLVRHVLIRTGTYTGQIMVCLVINGDHLTGDAEEAFVNDLTREFPEITSICLNINKKNTNVILGDRVICIYGQAYIEDKIEDLVFKISPLAFFQINAEQTAKLYAKALEYAALTGQETVWDLYCGTGTISLFLARQARKVYGVEIIPAAIDNARENAIRNGIKNAEFFCGKSEEVFPQMTKEQSPCQVVVLDPPRKGCDKALLEAIMLVEPERIVYVSCNSATLARDISILSEKYQLVEATPLDMFPHTVHVECVVLMLRKNT